MQKVWLIIMYSAVGIAAICLLILFIVDLIYGDPKTITTDPHNPYIGQGAHYMNEATHDKLWNVIGIVHHIGWVAGIIFIILGIVRMIKQARGKRGTGPNF
jgi:hypothetical protein